MEDRQTGIGGTDIAAIMGLNPWKSPMDVYLEKVGIYPPPPDNENMYWGREIEPALKKRYMREKGVSIVEPSPRLMRHPDFEWYIGSPDGLTDPPGGGVDYKTTGRRNDYGEPGTDQVPEHVACQCHWYMGLTGAEWWDVAVLFFAPSRRFEIFRLQRSEEIINNLIRAGKIFWENHVLPQNPPPIDASEGSKKLINHLYPSEKGAELKVADAEAEIIIQLLKEKEAARDKAMNELALVQNSIKMLIGESPGIISGLGKVTWRKSKDRRSIDWKAVADELVIMSKISPAEYKIIQDVCSYTLPGGRVLRTWWRKE